MVSSEIPQPAANLGVFLVEHKYGCVKCGKAHGGSGTGFLLNVPGQVAYLLTNYHVIEEGGNPDVTVTGTMTGYESKFTARVIGVDTQRDLALLRSHDMPRGRYVPVTLAQRSPPIGTRVEILGYPLAYVWPDAGRADVNRRAWFPLRYETSTTEKQMKFTGHDAYDGQSGSPGFSRGQVVCIFFGRTDNGAVGSPVEDVWSFLRDAAITLPERRELSIFK
jgi:S1-C subfamily serine protease